ncbi:hypothetical protein RUND412_001597 [Rhizina undulata]
MLPGDDSTSSGPELCTDDCQPSWAQKPAYSTSDLLMSLLPFIITFSLIFLTVLQRLFPVLCGGGRHNNYHHHPENRVQKRRISAIAFSTTLAATGVLAELVLCEVSEWVDADAKRFAFRIVVGILLVCLIVVIPVLELHSIVEGTRIGRWRWRYVVIVEMMAFACWFWVFWSLGDMLPIRKAEESIWRNSRTLSEECLARVGVIGVSLMALLSGFGSASSPWHNFTTKPRPITDIDVSRAQAGLDAATELLETKKNRLRFVEKKIQDKRSSQEGLMSKVLNSIRGDADSQEHSILKNELNGLETMRVSLAAELSELQRRVAVQERSKSTIGRLLQTISYGFSVYCLYRIAATSIAHMPFLHRTRDTSFSQNDPINNVLALLAKHWDPSLDRAAWSRQIGFAFSGVIIAGSLGSVMTTFNMLTRAAPGVIGHAVKGENPNLALFVAQISAVYVLASALLLRSNLPPQMSSVITDALGAPLDTSFVDRWFDGLFLGAAAVTGVGLVLGRRGRLWGRKEDFFAAELEELEAGKRN